MSDKSLKIKLCTVCGSTEILENYPAAGLSICADCGEKVATVPLKVIQEETEDKLLGKDYVCPNCHKRDDSDELASIDVGHPSDYNFVVVLKCNSCGALDGYRILPMGNYLFPDDTNFEVKDVLRTEKEGESVFKAHSANRIAGEIKKQEKDPVTLCQKKLERFLDEKLQEIDALGVSCQTVDLAESIAKYHITRKGPVTDKQLEYLLSAAIDLSQDVQSATGKLTRRVSERKISELFDADRVTTRKWKAMLQETRKS